MKDLSRYINKVPVKVELDTSLEKILAIQLLYKQTIDIMDTIEGGSVINVKSNWEAEAGSESEILNKPNLANVATSGSYTDLINKPITSYKNVYIGVAESSETIISSDYYHDSIEKGQPLAYNTVLGYIWLVLPSSYEPVVAMSLIEVPMTLDDTIDINNVSYKIWKSDQIVSGSFNLYLF